MGAEAFLSEQVIGLSESIDDRVAALLQAGTGITLTYNDGDGTLTIAASSSFDGTFAALTDKPTTLSGYGITDAQPLDSDLTAIAALTTTAFGRSLLTQADAAATRSTIGVGTGTIGGTTGSTDNAVLRADGTGGATAQGSSFVIADIATASPNNTVNHASIQAIGTTTNVSVSVCPKGSGAFSLQVPDGTATGGNARGQNAVDFQTARNAASQVASATRSSLLATSNCTVSAGNNGLVIASDASSVTSGANVAIIASLASSLGASGQAVIVGGDYHSMGVVNNTVILGGRWASGKWDNAIFHSSSRWSVTGDCQSFSLSGAARTTTNTSVEVYFGLGVGNQPVYITLAAGRQISGTLLIQGVKSDGFVCARYCRHITIRRVSNTTTLDSSDVVGVDLVNGTSITIAADNTNHRLAISVTGIASETWRWNCRFDGIEQAFGT